MFFKKFFVFSSWFFNPPFVFSDRLLFAVQVVVCWVFGFALFLGSGVIVLVIAIPVLIFIFVASLLWYLATLSPFGAVVAATLVLTAARWGFVEYRDELAFVWSKFVWVWGRLLVIAQPLSNDSTPGIMQELRIGTQPSLEGWDMKKASDKLDVIAPEPSSSVTNNILENLKSRIVTRSQKLTIDEATAAAKSHKELMREGLDIRRLREEADQFNLVAEIQRKELEDRLEQIEEGRRQRSEARVAKPDPLEELALENEKLRLRNEHLKLEEELARRQAALDKIRTPKPAKPTEPFEREFVEVFEREGMTRLELLAAAERMSAKYPQYRERIIRWAQQKIDALGNQ